MKRLLMILMIALLLTGCGKTEAEIPVEEPLAMETAISAKEYLDLLSDTFLDISNSLTEILGVWESPTQDQDWHDVINESTSDILRSASAYTRYTTVPDKYFQVDQFASSAVADYGLFAANLKLYAATGEQSDRDKAFDYLQTASEKNQAAINELDK